MKHILNILFGGVTLLAFAQCGSSQVFESNPPFSLDTAHIEPWTAGEADQYKGVNLFFPVASGKEIILDTVYFRTTKAPLMRIQKGSYLVYKATIENKEQPYDIIMHADPKKEFGNQPPRNTHLPFQLEHDQAVLSYSDGEQRKYYKVTGMQLAPAIHYEDRPALKN
ncbi:hypothetical protein [Robertkochia flava]|uniref:hypothetical protein n=1 Tax=Robertkochia flava TaxID=3447986 RepID=UPI001CCA3D73|nr:hypothetical protein [Robertkochia marina]